MQTDNTLEHPDNLVEYGIKVPLKDNTLGDPIENTEFQNSLAGFIKKQFKRAEDHKRAIGIEARLLRNLYAKKCEYSPEQAALIDENTNVYIGLCALKARAAESWMMDIILNNLDKPWTIKATPIPNLPKEIKEQVVDLLLGELSTLRDVTQLRERARELKTVAIDQANELAGKAIEGMELTIEDQLAEGDFVNTFTTLISDISTFPAIFLRGPITVSKTVAAWDGDTYTAKEIKVPSSRPINPFDAYPSPTSTTTQDGEFFIERARLLPSTLYESIKAPGFDEVNIRRALADYGEGYSINSVTDSERDRLEATEQGTTKQRTSIDTIIYNGLVPGKWLVEHKVLVKDPQKHYEAEIWVAGDYVIKATLNPNKTGKRPIHSTSYIKLNRSIWGQSVIDLIYDVERMCLAAVRSMVRNMAYSSGPMVEATADRLAPGTDPTELYPYKVFLVTPDLSGTGAPAIRFNNVDSVLPDLMAIYDRFQKVADDVSGIPAYVLGNPQVAGAGRTMGGLSMLMGNAAKGIKNVQLNVDREVITPLIEGYYDYNMQMSDDQSIKADATVVARGATGLMQKELAQSRLVEVLNLIVPLIPMWDKLPDGVKVILREFLKGLGLPIDDIIADPKQQANLLDKIRELTQNEASFRGTSSPVALPGQSAYPGSDTNTPIGAPGNVNPTPTPLATSSFA